MDKRKSSKGSTSKQVHSSSQSHSRQEGKSRNSISWNNEMDSAMAKAFYEQMNQGNKADGDWKPQAYQGVVDELNATFLLGLTKDNVKNRLKVWKKHYAVITDIKKQSGLTWDDERKLVSVTLENRTVWNTYVKDHPEASGYQNKEIENWEDIVMICGRDRATGDGAEDIGDAENAIQLEEENEESLIPDSHATCSSSDSHRSNKRAKIDPVAQSIEHVGNLIEKLITCHMPEQVKGHEIYEVVSKVPNLTRVQVLQAIKLLMSSNPEEFSLLKSLPEVEQTEWILFLLSQVGSKT